MQYTWIRLAESWSLIPPVGHDLWEVRDDNDDDERVKEEVGDGDPVLERAPVVGDKHPDVLDAGQQGEAEPGDDQTWTIKCLKSLSHPESYLDFWSWLLPATGGKIRHQRRRQRLSAWLEDLQEYH